MPTVHMGLFAVEKRIVKARGIRITPQRQTSVRVQFATLSVDLGNEVRGTDAQRRCKFVQDRNTRIARRAFNVGNVGAVDAGLESEFLLRQATGLAQTLQIGREAGNNVHACHKA